MTLTRKTQILVVDDNYAVRDLLRRLLEAAGYVVHAVADGRQALTLIHTQAVDLAVVDLYLPGLNGYALCAELQKKMVPVIFMSAALGPAEEEQAAALGASAFLRKPFHLADLERAVQQALRPATALRAPQTHPA